MTSKLVLYQKALELCGQRKLASVTEAVDSRYYCDQAYDNGAVDECLAEAQWDFAKRTIQWDYDTSVTTSFGYSRAFSKPSDYILTCGMFTDGYLQSPLLDYSIEGGYWYCDYNTIYLTYISNDASWGGNLTAWPAEFTEFVAAHIASKIVRRLAGNDENLINHIWNPQFPRKSIRGQALLKAKSRNAMGNPVQFIAQGGWSSSRQRIKTDGGSPTQLIG